MFLLTLLVLLLCASCTGNSGLTPGQHDDLDDHQVDLSQLQQVKMKPAVEQQPPFADTELPRSVSSPAALAGQLPSLRAASFLEEDLLRPGGSFDQTLPFGNVATSGPGDEFATFSPQWDDGDSGLDDAAFAIYRLPLADYGESSLEQTLGFSWGALLPAVQDLWIGLGNIGEDQWDWFAGEEDGVLTLDSFTPYEAGDGSVFCAIVLLGQQEAELEEMTVGAFELRGTGEEYIMFTPPAKLFPDFPLSIFNSVDLVPGCAPIGDQGSTSSCTAFAVANGALNYEMNALYGDCGWDFAVPLNRASPRFVYNQTGIDLGGSCPTGGRTTKDVAQWLLDNGAASEFNAPIGTVSPAMSYNCGASWSAAALADAALMQPTQYGFWGSYHPDNGKWYLADFQIEDIKSFLRTVRKPVIFRTDLDSNFSAVDYENGGSWSYSGPKTGGHAMLIVGYDDDRNGGSFKVRNSWGTNWGDDGYCWITYATMNSSGPGVYAAFIKCSYSEAAEERFCPEPPPFLPPLDIVFIPLFSHIEFSWEPIPGAERFVIYRDDMLQPVGFVSQEEGVDPMFADSTVDDFFTHVYWIRTVGGNGQSPLSEPFFLYRQPPT